MIKKNRSYPQELNLAVEVKKHEDTKRVLEDYKNKDYERADSLAQQGGLFSDHALINTPTRGQKCCDLFIRFGNYILEREEDERAQDEYIMQKSYAGFYFFIKWLVRTIVLTVFSMGGNVLGKEAACAIDTQSICEDDALTLWDSSPNFLAAILGTFSGLIIGQWLGRLVWDKSIENIKRCLRKLEKFADNTKLYLVFLSACVYSSSVAAFGIIFYEFVDQINPKKYRILTGCGVGGFLGLVYAVFAYRKTSPCIVGEKTPKIRAVYPPNIKDLDLEQI